MKEKFIAVVIAAIFSVALAGSAMAEDINAYMGTSPDNNAKIAKFIKDKTGITVNQTFQSCGEIEAKMKAEAPNFSADMIIGCLFAPGIPGQEERLVRSLMYPRPGRASRRYSWIRRATCTTSPLFPSSWSGTRTVWPRRVTRCRKAGRTCWIRNGRTRSSCLRR